MRIRFTKHALSRMKGYDISESEVLADIVPVGKVVQGRRDRKIAQKTVASLIKSSVQLIAVPSGPSLLAENA